MSESLTWVKSSYSSTGNCVEVAGQPGRVLVRDTKDQSGPVLSITAAAWRQFASQVRRSLAADAGLGSANAAAVSLIMDTHELNREKARNSIDFDQSTPSGERAAIPGNTDNCVKDGISRVMS